LKAKLFAYVPCGAPYYSSSSFKVNAQQRNNGDKTEVFALTRLLRPIFTLISLVVVSSAVFAQSSTVIEPCPSQTPAVANAVKVPTKAGVNVSETVVDSSVSDDPAVRDMLAPYHERVAALSMVIGKLEGNLKKESVGGGSLGNFVTDAMMRVANEKSGKNVVLALTNAGGLRKNEIAAGELRVSDIFELMPFENSLLVLDLTGAQILKILQAGTRDPQAGARIQYRWNEQNRTEVIGAKLVDQQNHEREIDPSAIYSVITIDYLYNLKSGTYGLLQEAKDVKPLNITLRDAVLTYVKEQTAAGHSIKPTTDQRFVQVGPGPTNPEVRPQ
jgi:2',3'-cyclic-nucleotide 2'-phosphodiesterase (5'-nucleotidase family)